MPPDYRYRTQDEMEADFIRDHRRHNVPRPDGAWLSCRTCGAVLKFVERDAGTVHREEFR